MTRLEMLSKIAKKLPEGKKLYVEVANSGKYNSVDDYVLTGDEIKYLGNRWVRKSCGDLRYYYNAVVKGDGTYTLHDLREVPTWARKAARTTANFGVLSIRAITTDLDDHYTLMVSGSIRKITLDKVLCTDLDGITKIIEMIARLNGGCDHAQCNIYRVANDRRWDPFHVTATALMDLIKEAIDHE